MAYFYEGLTPRDRQFVQLSCGGGFLQKEPENAKDYLDEIAENSNTWTGPSAIKSTDRSKVTSTTIGRGIYQLKEENTMKAKLDSLTKEIEALKLKILLEPSKATKLKFMRYALCVIMNIPSRIAHYYLIL